MYRADMIGIEIDGLPRSMYGDGPSVGGVTALNSAPPEPQGAACKQNVSRRQELKESLKNSKEYTVLKKVIRLLQDNRANSGDEETEAKLEEINRDQSDSYPVLKTILNVLFITTGLVLLIGVIVVIIYTSIVKPDQHINQSHSAETTPTAPPTTTTIPAEVIHVDPNHPLHSHFLEELLPNEEEPSPSDHTPKPQTNQSEHSTVLDSGLVSPKPYQVIKSSPAPRRSTKPRPSSDQATAVVQLIKLEDGQEVKAITRCRVQAIVQPDRTVRLGEICFQVQLELPTNPNITASVDLDQVTTEPSLVEPTTNHRPARYRRHDNARVT